MVDNVCLLKQHNHQSSTLLAGKNWTLLIFFNLDSSLGAEFQALNLGSLNVETRDSLLGKFARETDCHQSRQRVLLESTQQQNH